jgi:hypothetical protein
VLALVGGLLSLVSGSAQGWIGVVCGLVIIAAVLVDVSRHRP